MTRTELRKEVRNILDTSGSKCDNVYGLIGKGSVEKSIALIERYIAENIRWQGQQADKFIKSNGLTFQTVNDVDRLYKYISTLPMALQQQDYFDFRAWLNDECNSITTAGAGCVKKNRIEKCQQHVREAFTNGTLKYYQFGPTPEYFEYEKLFVLQNSRWASIPDYAGIFQAAEEQGILPRNYTDAVFNQLPLSVETQMVETETFASMSIVPIIIMVAVAVGTFIYINRS